MNRKVLLMVMLAFGGCNYSDQTNLYEEAALYLYDWDATSRFTLTVDTIQEFAHHSKVTRHKATLAKLERLLQDEGSFEELDIKQLDIRLFLEMKKSNGKSEIFVADRDFVCGVDLKKCKKTNKSWREQVTALIRLATEQRPTRIPQPGN